MLFKMLGIQRTWENYQEAMGTKPRQLFVTKSRVLADKVEEHFSKLQQSLAAGHLSAEQLRHGEVPPPRASAKNTLMLNADEEVYWNSNLPQRFGVLQEEHFPLFLTYDHVRMKALF